MSDPLPPASVPNHHDAGHIDRSNDEMPGVVQQQPSSEFPHIERIRNQSLPVTGLARTEDESGAASLRDRNTTHENPSLQDLDLEPLEELLESEEDGDSDSEVDDDFDWEPSSGAEGYLADVEEEIKESPVTATETSSPMSVDEQASRLAAVSLSEGAAADEVTIDRPAAIINDISLFNQKNFHGQVYLADETGQLKPIKPSEAAVRDAEAGNLIVVNDEKDKDSQFHVYLSSQVVYACIGQ